LYAYVDLLGEIVSLGVMRRRKGEKHCRASWFYVMEEMFFLQLFFV
jgi:hypothetical protein